MATFHSELERAISYPITGGRRKRYRARIDALLATSPRAAELASALYPGEYETLPDPLSTAVPARRQGRHRLVAEWTAEARAVAKALIRWSPRTPRWI